jgi:hypothetical protein
MANTTRSLNLIKSNNSTYRTSATELTSVDSEEGTDSEAGIDAGWRQDISRRICQISMLLLTRERRKLLMSAPSKVLNSDNSN